MSDEAMHCPATKDAVEKMEERGYGPGCELCGRPANSHPSLDEIDRLTALEGRTP